MRALAADVRDRGAGAVRPDGDLLWTPRAWSGQGRAGSPSARIALPFVGGNAFASSVRSARPLVVLHALVPAVGQGGNPYRSRHLPNCSRASAAMARVLTHFNGPACREPPRWPRDRDPEQGDAWHLKMDHRHLHRVGVS